MVSDLKCSFALLRLGLGFVLSLVTSSGPRPDESALRRNIAGSYDVRRMSGDGIATVGRLRARASNCRSPILLSPSPRAS